MAMSGTYMTDVPLKGTAEKHNKRWSSENLSSLTPSATSSMVSPSTTAIGTLTAPSRAGNGKEQVFKERIEMDDEKMAVAFNAIDGQVMEELKVYISNLLFIPESQNGCICIVSVIWEKRTQDSPEPTVFMKFLEKMVADMDDHILQTKE